MKKRNKLQNVKTNFANTVNNIITDNNQQNSNLNATQTVTNSEECIDKKIVDYELINQQINSCYNEINLLQMENTDLGSIKVNLEESSVYLKQFLNQYKNCYIIDNEAVNYLKYFNLYNTINDKTNQINLILSTNNATISNLHETINNLQNI